jgi:excinuclease ABC subunit A
VRPVFRFQYKGLYPALEEASRVSPSLRGQLQTMVDEVECSVCGGSRLRDDAAAVQLRGRTLDEVCRQPLSALLGWFTSWELSPREREIAGEVIREIRDRLQFLVDVGLEYLTLARPAPTLSGGEMQRIRLAAQVGSGLCGLLYVLDEPTIGLHPRDNRRLLRALARLRDLGNTLLVVEHDREVVQSADRLLDFGPGAGRDGGRIVAQGDPGQIVTRRASVTGPYLSGKKAIPVPTNRRMPSATGQRLQGSKQSAIGEQGSGFGVQGSGRGAKRARDDEPIQSPRAAARGRQRRNNPATPELGNAVPLPPGRGWLEILGARHNNLKSIDVGIPLGTLTVVTGTSGSGKSSLVEDVLYNALARTLHRARAFPGAHDGIRGLELVNKVIRVDQQPLGQTPTSNPATFTGVFDLIRSLFAQLPDAKLRGYSPRRFSFNVPGGRCEKCEGNGQLRIEMHFLPDVWVQCDACRGRRYEPETLAVRYHGQSIADVLDMPCGQAVTLFENVPKIRRILETLSAVGLDYLTLGQPAPTLSGGEAQRVKLAAELSRPDTGRTLYLLDEPTTGLHFDDLAKLLGVLNRLVDLGNTVVVIEHNLDVIKTADWVIDLGPEAGDEGGYLVAAGTPEDLVDHARRWQEEQNRGRRRRITDNEHPATRANAQGVRHPSPRSSTSSSHHSSFIIHQSALLRSYTGEVLDPVLSAGPFEERKRHDPAAEAEKREGEMDIADVGRGVRMPWEVDGRRWHTKDRVGRKGSPCRWDGRILADVVDRIEQSDLFSETDWASRGVVEIRAAKKSDGWFFHALTGEEWLLKMKFRTARKTFRREQLVERLDLKPLNEMPDLPLYGTEPRVRCKNLRGPWQEIELKVHGYQDVDRPEFWEFVDRAIDGFGRFADRASKRPHDLTPWKALGRKWHFMRKGFLKGGPPRWQPEVLEDVCRLLEGASPGCEFGWTGKVVVPVHVKKGDGTIPWASLQTKKPDAVHLALFGPKNRFPMGRLTDLGHDPDIDTERPEHDVIHLKFRSPDDLARGDLAGFLKEHVAALERP